MKKMNKLLAGFATLAMMASCSNDEQVPNITPEVPDGDVAYMKVQITAPSEETRSTTNGGHMESDGTEAEHKVNTVDFLFFNSDGAYAFTVKANDATFVAEKDDDGPTTENVEYIGKSNIVILEGVTQNNYPTYVMTILNRPSDFQEQATLQETADKLTAYATSFTGTTNSFVMTTSSFYGKNTGKNGVERHEDFVNNNARYFVTKLGADDFKATLDDAKNTDQPVEIYVERLAAKVEMKIGGETGSYEDADYIRYYKLSQTLAGGDDNTSGDNVSDVDLYVKVLGWGLNATAKESYMSKKLQQTWQATGPFSDWNPISVTDNSRINTYWRSYWGEAYTYKAYADEAALKGSLYYTTPKQVVAGNKQFIAPDNVEYCYENTNNPENIFKEVDGGSLTLNSKKVNVNESKVTHVVLYTQIYQKNADKTFTAPSLVQFKGVLYTEASYKAMLLNALKAQDKLNYWRYTGTETDPATDTETAHWKSIGAEDLKMDADKSDGHKLGQIKIVAKALQGEDKIYEKTTTGYMEITSTFKNTIDAALAGLYTDTPAVGADEGKAFYYIPIEHLAAKEGETNAVEGYYGVVRNHWYRLTVNSFKKVGHLVFKPEEDETPIIPGGPEDPLYYVGAKINILSWKVVEQKVDL